MALALLLVACNRTSGGGTADRATTNESHDRFSCVEDLAHSLQDQSELAADALGDKAPEMIAELRSTLSRETEAGGHRVAYDNLKRKVSETGAAATAYVVKGRENAGSRCRVPKGAGRDDEFVCWSAAVNQHKQTVGHASAMVGGPLQDIFNDLEDLFRAASEGDKVEYRASYRRIANDLRNYNRDLQTFSDLINIARDRHQDCA